jgi:hypothetical protein
MEVSLQFQDATGRFIQMSYKHTAPNTVDLYFKDTLTGAPIDPIGIVDISMSIYYWDCLSDSEKRILTTVLELEDGEEF